MVPFPGKKVELERDKWNKYSQFLPRRDSALAIQIHRLSTLESGGKQKGRSWLVTVLCEPFYNLIPRSSDIENNSMLCVKLLRCCSKNI